MKKRILVCLFLTASLIVTELPLQVCAKNIGVDGIIEKNIISASSEQCGNDLNISVFSDKKNLLVSDGYDMEVKIAKSNDDEIRITTEDNLKRSIELPKEVHALDATLGRNGVLVYSSNNSNTAFGVNAINEKNKNDILMEGIRTSIVIRNNEANHSYSFKYNLDKGERLVKASEYLGKEFDTQEVFVVDATGCVKMVIDAPWARDAKGKALDTSYSIDGNTLTQNISFDKNTAFPVVADPSAWEVTKCVGSLVWVVGSTVFVGAKLVKIKKYIKALGGVREAAALLVGATSVSEKGEAAGRALINLAATLSGVDSVYTNCHLNRLLK